MRKIIVCLLLLLVFGGCNRIIEKESSSDTMAKISSSESVKFSEEMQSNPEESNDLPVSKFESSDDILTSEEETQSVSESKTEQPSSAPRDLARIEWERKIWSERGVSDVKAHYAAILELENQLINTLDENIYGGVEQIKMEFAEDTAPEKASVVVGLQIYYVDIEKVKAGVNECLNQLKPSTGKIDIEYIKHRYSLIELNEIADKIKAAVAEDTTLKENVGNIDVYVGAGVVGIHIDKGADALREYIDKQKYMDYVRIIDFSKILVPVV